MLSHRAFCNIWLATALNVAPYYPNADPLNSEITTSQVHFDGLEVWVLRQQAQFVFAAALLESLNRHLIINSRDDYIAVVG